MTIWARACFACQWVINPVPSRNLSHLAVPTKLCVHSVCHMLVFWVRRSLPFPLWYCHFSFLPSCTLCIVWVSVSGCGAFIAKKQGGRMPFGVLLQKQGAVDSKVRLINVRWPTWLSRHLAACGCMLSSGISMYSVYYHPFAGSIYRLQRVLGGYHNNRATMMWN